MSEQTDKPSRHRREEVLREELEERLVFFEETDDAAFGKFTALDWLVCTLLFFVLPIVTLALLAP